MVTVLLRDFQVFVCLFPGDIHLGVLLMRR